MDRLKAGIEEPVRGILHSPENLGGYGVFLVARFETHDADVLGAEALHSRNRAFNFRQGDLEWVGNFLRPIHDRGAKAIDANAGGFELIDGDVESRIGNIVKI